MLESDLGGPGTTSRRRRRQESRETSVARILGAAEALCAIHGSAKTNVCDIASYLSMSPANVYRFFPSKLALYDALVARVLEDTFPATRSGSDKRPSAATLREFLCALYRGFLALMRDEEKVFELLTVADDEHWPAFEAHVKRVRSIIAELVDAGVRAREFRQQDSLRAAECLSTSTAALWEPKAVKTFHLRRSLITPEELISFSIEALGNGALPC
ncbi:TetR/AcrR family transcriptional regulator [Rhizobium ruizarguesonis]